MAGLWFRQLQHISMCQLVSYKRRENLIWSFSDYEISVLRHAFDVTHKCTCALFTIWLMQTRFTKRFYFLLKFHCDAVHSIQEYHLSAICIESRLIVCDWHETNEQKTTNKPFFRSCEQIRAWMWLNRLFMWLEMNDKMLHFFLSPLLWMRVSFFFISLVKLHLKIDRLFRLHVAWDFHFLFLNHCRIDASLTRLPTHCPCFFLSLNCEVETEPIQIQLNSKESHFQITAIMVQQWNSTPMAYFSVARRMLMNVCRREQQ